MASFDLTEIFGVTLTPPMVRDDDGLTATTFRTRSERRTLNAQLEYTPIGQPEE
jgi:hypothetical protein